MEDLLLTFAGIASRLFQGVPASCVEEAGYRTIDGFIIVYVFAYNISFSLDGDRLGVFTEAYQVAVESKRAKPMPYADDGGCTSNLQYHF